MQTPQVRWVPGLKELERSISAEKALVLFPEKTRLRFGLVWFGLFFDGALSVNICIMH